GPGRLVVDRADVDRDRVRALVEVETEVCGLAVVLEFGGERRRGRAVGVGGRAELQPAEGDVGGRDELAGRHRAAVVQERAGERQGRDLDGQEAVGGRGVVGSEEGGVGGGGGVGWVGGGEGREVGGGGWRGRAG